MRGIRTPKPIPLESARRLFHYDPDTGVFTNRATGEVVPVPADWYRRQRLSIDGKSYYAHRVAWAMVHGVDPSGVIDHINQDIKDNRIANLRDVSQSENARNVAPEKRTYGQSLRQKGKK